ncbi:eukaryotic peptide chain release factor subunit 1 [soil metagenome]
MPVVTEDVIRSLAGFRGQQAPVISCYLDVDGRRYVRHQDYETVLDALLRDARTKANGDSSVHNDLRRIEEYVKAGIDRSNTRGLAFFACTAHDLWEVIALPVPVHNRIVVNHAPAVGQLPSVLEEYERFGVLLADRQRARMFVFELGELTDRSELFEELPRDYDTRGERERGDTRPHVEALAHQHLSHAAEVAGQVFQDHGFEHLAIGAPDEIAGELEALLHPYLKDRRCGRLGVPVGSSLDDIREAALDLETRIERQKEAEVVERLREAVATGRRGIAGLGPVLAALADRRFEQLVVSQGYEEAGWRCPGCGCLAVVGRRCGRCETEMDPVGDIVEEAVEEALAQSSKVEICIGSADLDVLGRVGALLRY